MLLSPHTNNCGSSSVGRASAFQAEGREFESRLPLKTFDNTEGIFLSKRQCSSVVEYFLGKEGVASSILAIGSKKLRKYSGLF